MEDKVRQVLYELGFLDKKGNREKDLDRRWRVNLNEAELIIKDALKDVRRIETYVSTQLDDYWKERLHARGKDYTEGYEDALYNIRSVIRKLHEGYSR